MNIEKTIKICDKDVIMRYCAGAETGYEILADGKSSEVFAPTIAEKDENGKPVKYNLPKATTDDWIKLATAAIIAAYEYRSEENHVVEPPVSPKDILFSASPAEVTEMIKTVIELRAAWYAVPKTVPESEFNEQPEGKGGEKNVQQPANASSES